MYNVQKLVEKETFQLERKELADLPAEHILIKTKAAGLCGSDLEYYKYGYCGAFMPKNPIVLGHEFVGEVAELAEGVANLSVGDAVVIDPSMPCGKCSYCKTGNYHFCENMRFLGSASCFPHIDGGFAEYAVVPAANAHVFDLDKVDWQTMALVEPLMVSISVVTKIERLPFRDVAVFGGGTIGQLILDVLRAWGAKSCTLIDPREVSHNFAKKRGFVSCFTPQQAGAMKFDVCIEAAGSPKSLLQCFDCINKQGLIVQVGTIMESVSLPVNQIMSRELTVKGSFRYANLFGLAVDLLQSRKLDVSYIITQTVSLEELKKGFELLLDPTIDTLKVQVLF